jgi:sarcosine oxidase subunit beta
MTEESVRFYDEGVRLFETMSRDLGFNIMYSQRGQLTLAHSDATMRSFHLRAEMGKHVGTRIEVVDAKTVKELVPHLNLDIGGMHEVLGGLWHADGGTARHDAVAWGYAKHASRRGVEIHQRTEVTGFDVSADRVTHVRTNRGTIAAGQVLQAVGGLNGQVAALAGIRLPIRCFPLQAMVTQPLKPFLHTLVSSANLHTYLVQSARGEVVIGGGSDPYQLASTRSTLDQKEHLAEGALHLFPFLHKVKLLRQWAGITDMTPDYSPIMGASPLANYWLDCGWGTWGFKATPVAGKRMAETIATGKVPDILKPFDLRRFDSFALLNEMGATAASH